MSRRRATAARRPGATAAVVVRHERGAARHRFHRRHAQSLVPRRTQVDVGAGVERGQSILGGILVELVVAVALARWFDTEPDETHRRPRAPDTSDGFDAIGTARPGVIWC